MKRYFFLGIALSAQLAQSVYQYPSAETSKDCRAQDPCPLPDGKIGFCRQQYCGLYRKCFICAPPSHEPLES
jgi:hypothetical protein